MSVIKNKRNLASVQYLTNLSLLMTEVREWCKAQSRKNDEYGLKDLFQATKNAYVCASMANSRYPKDFEAVAERKAWFDKSLAWLHAFNGELTSVCVSFPISNTKIKRWMKYVNVAIHQIEGIKKSDVKRVKKPT